MSLELKKRGNTRITPVSIYETDGDQQSEMILNVEHLRLTQEVGAKLDQLTEEIEEEQESYFENKQLPLNKRKKLAKPRNLVVEQLTVLITDPDILENGEKVKPSRELFTRLEAHVNAAILNGITSTIIPEKKKL